LRVKIETPPPRRSFHGPIIESCGRRRQLL